MVKVKIIIHEANIRVATIIIIISITIKNLPICKIKEHW